MSQDLNKSSRALVLDLINTSNALNLTEDDLIWGTPTEVSGRADGRNTSLLVTFVPESGHDGAQTIFYKRLDLAQMFREIPLIFQDVAETYQNTSDIVALLNANHGLALGGTDVVFEPLSRTGEGPWTFVMQAHPNSLAYKGSVQFVLTPDPVETTEGPFLTSGFIFINSSQSQSGTQVDDLSAVEDTEAPTVPSTDKPVVAGEDGNVMATVVTGGYENEIYSPVTNADGKSVDLHYSLDGGATWGVQTIPRLILYPNVSNAVFFKGDCYFVGALTSADAAAGFSGVYRVRPPASGETELTLELMINVRWPVQIAADDTSISVVTSKPRLMYFSTDGVGWSEETLPYEAIGAGYHQGKPVLLLIDKDNQTGSLAIRESTGTFTTKPIEALDLRGPWFALTASFFSTENVLNLTLSSVSMADFSFNIGDILQTADLGDTWTIIHENTGVYASMDALDDGETVVLLGAQTDLTSMGGEVFPAKAAISSNRASSFSTYTAEEFPVLSNGNERTLGAVIRKKKGDKPPITEVPGQNPIRLQEHPLSIDRCPMDILTLSDGRIVMGGWILYSRATADYPSFTEVDGTSLGTPGGLVVLDENGNVLPFTMPPEITYVYSIALTADEKILVVCNTPEHTTINNTVVRLNSDLTIDETFTPPTITVISTNAQCIHRAYALADGKVLLVGNVMQAMRNDLPGQPAGTSRLGLMRLNADGSFDSTFVSPITNITGMGTWHQAKVLPSGRIVVGFPNSNPGRTVVLDVDGAVLSGFDYSNMLFSVDMHDAYEYSNGDILIGCSPSELSPYVDQTILKILPDGSIVDGLPINTLTPRVFLGLGGDRVLMSGNQAADTHFPLVVFEPDNSVTEGWCDVEVGDIIQRAALQPNGMIVVAMLNSANVRQAPFPRYRSQVVERVFRFDPNPT